MSKSWDFCSLSEACQVFHSCIWTISAPVIFWQPSKFKQLSPWGDVVVQLVRFGSFWRSFMFWKEAPHFEGSFSGGFRWWLFSILRWRYYISTTRFQQHGAHRWFLNRLHRRVQLYLALNLLLSLIRQLNNRISAIQPAIERYNNITKHFYIVI